MKQIAQCILFIFLLYSIKSFSQDSCEFYTVPTKAQLLINHDVIGWKNELSIHIQTKKGFWGWIPHFSTNVTNQEIKQKTWVDVSYINPLSIYKVESDHHKIKVLMREYDISEVRGDILLNSSFQLAEVKYIEKETIDEIEYDLGYVIFKNNEVSLEIKVYRLCI